MLHLLESRIGRDLIRGRWLILLAGVGLTLFACLLSVWRPALVSELDQRVYDLLLRVSAESIDDPQVVIVDIDDPSLQEYGQWPWPRSLLALLLDQVRHGEPRAVGVDMMLAEPDRMHPEALDSQLREWLEALFQTPTPPYSDQALARVLADGPFVLGYKVHFDAPGAGVWTGAEPSALALPVPESRLFEARGRLGILPELAESISAAGFLNAVADRDGIFRRIPLLITAQGDLYPGLALATLLLADGVETPALLAGRNELFLRWGERRVPLDKQGNFLVDFPAARGGWQRISAATLLDDPQAAARLKDKVVFVGVAATGLDTRLVSPLGETFLGVEIHARIAANILNGDFIRVPGWFPGADILMLVVSGLLLPILLAWLSPTVGLLLTALSGLLLWTGSAWLLNLHGLFLSPVMPVLLMCAILGAATLLRFRFEERRSHQHQEQTEFMQNFMMQSLCSLASIRDSETGAHILRTEKYLRSVAEELGHHPRYGKILTPDTIDLLCRLASLHDIGKVGVPDLLLLKPGPLTSEEYEEIKKHTTYGRQVIDEAERRAGVSGSPALQTAREIVYCHHEWWDGSGYPEGLKGEEIPLPGRLMAIADVYDALVCQRVYKPSISHDAAVRIIRQRSGTQFDPEIVEAFLRVEKDWKRIYGDLKGQGENEELPNGIVDPLK
ncbi:CHASE2 domain-containing protein [Desulfuromonas acetexigens]|uniref:CHASE2 domain-containing protein n=1 Tax=Trichloromonas acetexigens TaxID=38815 RepID=A0A550J628_9BACT|nr:CHASE2 domain-containing protein [Desulfuromonas acetexigens]TRO78710.1 CHASE2 domain-containing protein [Desulfuromonas acetexigens]